VRFYTEVAKYPKSSLKSHSFGTVRAYCLAPLAMQLILSDTASH